MNQDRRLIAIIAILAIMFSFLGFLPGFSAELPEPQEPYPYLEDGDTLSDYWLTAYFFTLYEWARRMEARAGAFEEYLETTKFVKIEQIAAIMGVVDHRTDTTITITDSDAFNYIRVATETCGVFIPATPTMATNTYIIFNHVASTSYRGELATETFGGLEFIPDPTGNPFLTADIIIETPKGFSPITHTGGTAILTLVDADFDATPPVFTWDVRGELLSDSGQDLNSLYEITNYLGDLIASLTDRPTLLEQIVASNTLAIEENTLAIASLTERVENIETELASIWDNFNNYRPIGEIITAGPGYTISESDAWCYIRVNGGTVTVPATDIPVKTSIEIRDTSGAGLTFASSGSTIAISDGLTYETYGYGTVSLIKTGATTWELVGELVEEVQ